MFRPGTGGAVPVALRRRGSGCHDEVVARTRVAAGLLERTSGEADQGDYARLTARPAARPLGGHQRLPASSSRRPACRVHPIRPGQRHPGLLPFMRSDCSGLVVTISSTAGVVGQEFCSVYAVARFE